MMREPASRSVVLRSSNLILVASNSCALVMVPTFFLFGSPEPAAMLATFFSSTEAGGCLVMKVKLLSLYTEMTVGRTSPALLEVAALNSLQKAMMLTPA